MISHEIMHDLLAPPDADGRCFGVVVGIVTNNQDPDGMHRVKMRLPWLSAQDETNWARVLTPMAGGGRGAYFLPEVDDEVLVAFEHGSLEHPYVLGSLWNGKDSAHENNKDGKNDNRSIKSRSGHVIRLCDSESGGAIEIIDQTGNNRITVHSQNNQISIEAQGDIQITSATGKVKIQAVGIELTSTTDVKIQAQTTLDASASAEVTVQGAVIKLN
jgi:uncharacterized protein involved in type VI secretion and phage assembly